MSDKEKEQLKAKYKKDILEAINDLKTPGRRYRQIPNILTASRLLSPLAILPAAFAGSISLTAGLALGFGLTDCFDGAIARKLKIESELGADLDAVTDKVFVGTLLIASAFFNPILLCNLGLEGVISAINIKQKLSGEETASTMIGKYKTWAVFGLAALGLVAPQIGLSGLVNALAIGTAAMQGLTIGSYLTKYGKSDKITRTPEVKNVVDSLLEDDKRLLEDAKSKEKENTTNSNLDELRNMREFFHQEQINRTQTNQEHPKVYRKKDETQ